MRGTRMVEVVPRRNMARKSYSRASSGELGNVMCRRRRRRKEARRRKTRMRLMIYMGDYRIAGPPVIPSAAFLSPRRFHPSFLYSFLFCSSLSFSLSLSVSTWSHLAHLFRLASMQVFPVLCHGVLVGNVRITRK